MPLSRRSCSRHGFWQTRFAGRADIIGQDIVAERRPLHASSASGPQGYRGTTVLVPDVWVPLTALRARPADGGDASRPRERRTHHGRPAEARRQPRAGAGASRTAFSADLERQFPEIYRGRGLAAAKASRVPGIGREFVAPFLAVLMGVAGLVLLVTCTNLAGMMLARGAARSREIAVRLALGASRRALVAMLMTEALVFSAVGGAGVPCSSRGGWRGPWRTRFPRCPFPSRSHLAARLARALVRPRSPS